MLTAVVLTKNEEKNIKDCLKSLQWCNEILVVDDYSEDKTLKKIQRYKDINLPAGKAGIQDKVKIFQRKLDDDFADQRNFGLKQAKNEWVLFVDADEIISKALAEEIMSRASCSVPRSGIPLRGMSRVNGFYIKRKDFFLGHELKHGETGRAKFLRLGKRTHGKWERKVHETWGIRGEIGQLKNPILHYHQNLTDFLKNINYFSTIDAQIFYKQGEKATFLEWLKPPAKFVQNYFLRLGFLDGAAGFVHAALMSLHSFLVRAKLFMLWKKEGGWGR